MTPPQNSNNSKNAFEGFILAGGRSSRMGTEKAAIDFLGDSLLERTAKTLFQAGAARVSAVVGKHTEADLPEGIGTVRDTFTEAGALGGIHAALEACATPVAFICACDMPFASAGLASLLLDLLDGHDCLLPEQAGGKLQPLFAAYKRESSLISVRSILEDTGASRAVASFIDTLDHGILRFEKYSHLPGSKLLLMNVNTPGDLDRALRAAGN